jgi:hypothetical protein
MTRADEVSDEMLMALADGELTDPDARILHQRIAADPDLAERYAVFAETRALMQAAYPPEPVPDRLIAAALQAEASRATVLPFRRRVVAVSGWGMALAASVVLAVGGFWIGRNTAPSLTGTLDLGTATAGLPTGGEMRLPDGSTVRVLASYATDLGLCRMIAGGAGRQIACRDEATGTWAVALSVQDGGSGGFLPASDIATGMIDRFLDEIGAGPALAPDEERRALGG